MSFSIAERVWDDPLHVLVFDRYEKGESRGHAIGVVASVTVLVVVHNYPDSTNEDRVRIIGARRATPRERRRYEQETP